MSTAIKGPRHTQVYVTVGTTDRFPIGVSVVEHARPSLRMHEVTLFDRVKETTYRVLTCGWCHFFFCIIHFFVGDSPRKNQLHFIPGKGFLVGGGSDTNSTRFPEQLVKVVWKMSLYVRA